MSELTGLSLPGFGEALASSAATPGGGCASALSGSLAAGLVAMVARTTTGERFAEVAPRMEEAASEADGLRVELLGLVDEDAAAFETVMAAFRLPKETDAEKAARSAAIQEAYKAAAEPPLRVCRDALRVLELAAHVAADGNPNAASDAGVAALLAAAALEGAALNVETNLGSIKDEAYRADRGARAREARARGEELREQALAAARAKLR